MAEIQIERKASTGKVWLWVLLGLVVLGAIVWYIANSRVVTAPAVGAGGDAAGEVAAPVVGAAPAPTASAAGAAIAAGAATGAPVANFLAWQGETRAGGEAGIDHEYVSNGITRLAGAIADLAARDSLAGSSVAEQVQALNRLAVQVQQDPQALSHADLVHAAFLSSAALLGDIQRHRFPAAQGAVAQVREAANAVDKRRPLLEQKAQMTRYFEQAATAVRAMSADA